MATPSAVVALLKACAHQKDLSKGSRLHAAVSQNKLLRDNIIVGNALLNMYAKCGALGKAQQVFDLLPDCNIIAWTSLITAYTCDGHGPRALQCFDRMMCEGVSPDAITFSCILKACGNNGAAKKGEATHAVIEAEGLLVKDTALGNALVDMYAKCGALAKAQKVFDKLNSRDVVSWTALIVGYCQHGQCRKAIRYFEQMRREGLRPNELTFSSVLKACGSMGAIKKGVEIHNEIMREGLLARNGVLGTALLDMYLKCGVLAKAQEVFDELAMRDKVSWTSLIAGYCQHGRGEEAINCFGKMLQEGLFADVVTLGSILQACGTVGASEKGKKIHAKIIREGFLSKDVKLGNALVAMYTKCGTLTKAQQIFNELSVQDVASWTSLMAGYAHLGKHNVVFESFTKLVRQGIEPDAVLFNIVLNVCRQFGLVDKGQTYFEIASASYGIIPTLAHYTYMVDLFGRVGHLEEAMVMIKKMPPFVYAPAWFAFLSACRKWGNVRLGRVAFEHVVQITKMSTLAYIA